MPLYALQWLLGEARRRAVKDNTWERAVADLAHALTELRLAEKHEAIAQADAGSLRLRLLRALSVYPLRTKDLARAVAASDALVSRTLTALRQEGYVAYETLESDRRGRLHRLTDEGKRAQRRWGVAVPLQRERRGEDALLRETLIYDIQKAVQLRRCDDALEDAATVLERCLSEAQALDDKALWLRALVELAVTHRQAGDLRGHHEHLRRLEAVAAGAVPAYAAVSSRAMAHLLYERGRRRDEIAARRLNNLTSAAALFGELAAHGSGTVDDPSNRRVWALLGAADLLRQHTALGAALEIASECGRRFTEQGDDYGAASSLVLSGFCLRLRGRFDEAIKVLDVAMSRAADAHVERLRLNAAIQLGETYRAAGRTTEAAGLLRSVVAAADGAGMLVSQGFAACHLGAVAYAEGASDDAVGLLSQAEQIFDQAKHRDGMALALRRHATVMGERADADTAFSMLRRAQRRYENAGSPAGVVACIIERGRAELASGGTAARTSSALQRHLAAPEDTQLIALDPWVPSLLDDFTKRAQQTGVVLADALLERTEEVLRAASTAAHADHHTWTWVRETASIDASRPAGWPARLDVMAGEHRKRTSLVGESLFAEISGAS
jgi:DNA-binding MarR family transcriptional regulator